MKRLNINKIAGRLHLDGIVTAGLVVTSLFFTLVGSGWRGAYRIGFLKISLHSFRNLEIALWCLAIFKIIIAYLSANRKDKDSQEVIFQAQNKRLLVLGYLAIILFLFILYSNTLNTYFACDDAFLLKDVRTGFSNSVLYMSSMNTRHHFIRPLTCLSWLIDYKLFSLRPFGWHLSSLILHSANIFLVILVVRLLTNNLSIALITGLLFGFSPIHHEVINSPTFRADLVNGIFLFASIYFFIRFRNNRKNAFLYASLLAFTLALLSKELAICIPVIIIFMDLALYKNIFSNLKDNLKIYAHYFLVLGLYLVMRFLVYGTINPGSPLGGSTKFFVEFIPGYIRGAFFGFFIPMFFPINWDAVEFFKFYWIRYILFLYAISMCLLIIFNIKKAIGRRILLAAFSIVMIIPAFLFNVWEIGRALHATRFYYLVGFGFYLFLAYICLIDNRSLLQKRLNLLGLGIIFICSLIFIRVNNLAWIEVTRIPLRVMEQTKVFSPEPKKDARWYYFDLPQAFLGISIYGWETVDIEEQLSQIYKNPPRAIAVRNRGIMLDLAKLGPSNNSIMIDIGKIDFAKDKVFQWDNSRQQLLDITIPLEEAINAWSPDKKLTSSFKESIGSLRSWKSVSGFVRAALISDTLYLSSRALPYLSVRMKVVPSNKIYYQTEYSGWLYWKTNRGDFFGAERATEFWIVPQDIFANYNIFFVRPQDILRDDYITQFLFIPAGFPAQIEIKSIKLMFER